MSNRLRDIEALGQSIWQDNISRQLLDDGILRRRIEEDGISGVTSNPTIFEKAMVHSDAYDDAFREQLGETSDVEEIFNQLAYRDIRDTADLLRPRGTARTGLTATCRSRWRRRWRTIRTRRSKRPSIIAPRSIAPTC